MSALSSLWLILAALCVAMALKHQKPKIQKQYFVKWTVRTGPTEGYVSTFHFEQDELGQVRLMDSHMNSVIIGESVTEKPQPLNP